MEQTIHIRGACTAAQEKTYLHLPFDMPPGAVRLHVEYSYSDRIGAEVGLTGGNTVDLGLFDERGADFLSGGSRGWSGSERSSFFIAEDEATPGYLAGPLLPGRWRVLLGLYKVAPRGCTYEVTITVQVEPGHLARSPSPAPASDLPASPPCAAFAPWLRGELHCHTFHSDGIKSPAELVRLARDRGLDFLAVTDHNTTSSQRELETISDPGLILLRGMESTTFRGHWNAWGSAGWVDFRTESPEQMADALRHASRRGALTSCNHPGYAGMGWEYREVEDYDCVEVWNGPWSRANAASLAFWAEGLSRGWHKPAVGGSDYHGGEVRAPGTPTTWVHVDGAPNAGAILDAIRRGHVVLSTGPAGPLLELETRGPYVPGPGDTISAPADGRLPLQVRCRGQGGRLLLLDQNGAIWEGTIAGGDETRELELAVDTSRCVRAELWAADGSLLAMTNPIYLEPEA